MQECGRPQAGEGPERDRETVQGREWPAVVRENGEPGTDADQEPGSEDQSGRHPWLVRHEELVEEAV